MNITTITAWFSENKLVASLAAAFVVAIAGLGYLSWSAWDDFNTATDDYNSKASELDRLSHKAIFPNQTNLEKLQDTFAQNQKNLTKLTTALQKFKVPPFGDIEKSKPQDQPQRFQDALRSQVTAIKTLSTTSGSTLPTIFYLGLDEYENQPPKPEEVPNLAKQLTVLSWIASTIVSQKGLVASEFVRTHSDSPTAKSPAFPNARPLKPSPSAAVSVDASYETVGSVHVTLHCDQIAFRELINAISTAPYLLVIEDMHIQNSGGVGEPPRRDSTDASAQTDTAQDGSTSVQRLPVIVGRESLNVTLRIRAFDFPSTPGQPHASK